jgi:hypothetical protein
MQLHGKTSLAVLLLAFFVCVGTASTVLASTQSCIQQAIDIWRGCSKTPGDLEGNEKLSIKCGGELEQALKECMEKAGAPPTGSGSNPSTGTTTSSSTTTTTTTVTCPKSCWSAETPVCQENSSVLGCQAVCTKCSAKGTNAK